MTGRTPADIDRLQTHLDRLRELYLVAQQFHGGATGFYAGCLDAGRRWFGLETGLVSEITGPTYRIVALRHEETFGLTPNDVLRVADTPCAALLDSGGPIARPLLDASAHPAFAGKSYIGAQLRVNGRIFGTLCFLGLRRDGEAFHDDDLEFVDLIARTLGNLIERQQSDERQREAQRIADEMVGLFGTAFTQAPIGMALVSLDGRWLRVNPAICRLVGYSEAELLSLDFQSITYPEDLHKDLGQVRRLLKGSGSEYQIEKRYIHRDGRVIWASLTVFLARNEAGAPRYFISQIQDISERKAMIVELERKTRQLEDANRKLAALATTDPLTGLLNRRAFDERLASEVERARREASPLSVIMLDVDNFKAYNDRYGHPAGDAALVAIADCLRGTIRSYDSIARYGGEEFIALLPGATLPEALAVAERMRLAMAGLALEQKMTVSAGVHSLDLGEEAVATDAESLIATADLALYRAKDGGRDRVEGAGAG